MLNKYEFYFINDLCRFNECTMLITKYNKFAKTSHSIIFY